MDETPVAGSPAETPKRSPVEGVKETSRYLRGKIVTELNAATDNVSKESYNLLKFHGSYQQEDRDARKTRSQTGIAKHWMFMVRCKIPGGRMTGPQYLALDELAGKHANGTIRITTRQGIQFHGVLKRDLHATIAGINGCLLTTLGACGDVERNVMCCPAPLADGLRGEINALADQTAEQFAPKSRAYHEIWLNGQPLEEKSGEADSEPLYGKTYLPRKFKTGITLPSDNCVDIYAQDLGFVADVQGGRIAGWNVLVGGGMGMAHGNVNTFPFLAKPITWVSRDELLPMAEAVIKLYRDHGNRGDRKRARIKYLVHDWGVAKFRDVLATYFGKPLPEARPFTLHELDLHHGWQPQGDGRFFYGLSVENGRIKDEGVFRLRSALRAIVTKWNPAVRLTPQQDLLLCDLPAEARPDIDQTLAQHGVRRPHELTIVQKLSMACPAIPTCGLAVTESERALPGIIDQLEAELARLGLADEPISVRMTGCPNGCARPYQSDIGIVGRSGDKFTVYVGGRPLGDRLNFILKDMVPRGDIVPLLLPLLAAFKEGRQAGESFGDFCTRLGAAGLGAKGPLTQG
jgi:sulfite reductase (ferredoxin)